MNQIEKYFLPYQYAWILDSAHLRIFEKARQTGMTHTDAYDSVIKATTKNHPLDVLLPQVRAVLKKYVRGAN